MEINSSGITERKGRNVTIDLLRVVFSIIIFLNHSATLINSSEQTVPYFRYGFLGVEFFFILSGYLMSAKASRVMQNQYEIGPETVRFVLGKISSIFPWYIVAWIIGMIIDGWGKEIHESYIHVFQSLPTIIQINMAGFNGYNVLKPTWYISAMILSMMSLYPLLLRYKKTFNMAIAPVICVFTYGIFFLKIGNLASLNDTVFGIIYTGLLRAIAGISLGCICYACAQRLSECPLKKVCKPIIAVLEILVFAVAILFQRTGLGFRPDFLFVCLAALGIILAFCRHNAFNDLFQVKKNWIGRFALCIYLSDVLSRMIILKLMPDATRDQRLLPAFGLLFLIAILVFISGYILRWITVKLTSVCKKAFLNELPNKQ